MSTEEEKKNLSITAQRASGHRFANVGRRYTNSARSSQLTIITSPTVARGNCKNTASVQVPT